MLYKTLKGIVHRYGTLHPQDIIELENINILIFKYSAKNIRFPRKITMKTSNLMIIESKRIRQRQI